MIALLARNLALTLFLAFLVVALLEQFNPTPPQMAIDFHRADFPVCATVHNAPLAPKASQWRDPLSAQERYSMSHAITWGSLFGVGFILAGLLGIGGGGLAIFAGGMSDAPEAGDSTARTGCFIAVAGAALLALGIWCVS